MTCFHFRRSGHALAHCPEQLKQREQQQNESSGGEPSLSKKQKKKLQQRITATPVMAVCYRCGSTEHSLAQCSVAPNQSNGENSPLLPYATCFICNQVGHLASTCPSNPHGIYVNGGANGCCKECGSKLHRARDCPENKRNRKNQAKDNDAVPEEDYSHFAHLLPGGGGVSGDSITNSSSSTTADPPQQQQHSRHNRSITTTTEATTRSSQCY